MHSRDTFIFPKFASQVFNLLSSQYKQTYFVGGAVLNALLHKKIIDVDIATSAKPQQIISLLEKNKIKFSSAHKNFGVIIAISGEQKIEITTFRKDSYSDSRYPTITFANTPKTDSNRRDFTINALYYRAGRKGEKGTILDFHDGLKDIKNNTLRFIGKPEKRIQEDPLRIVRAHRFALQYNLKFDSSTLKAVQQNKNLLQKISKTRIEKEISQITSQKIKKLLQKVIHN